MCSNILDLQLVTEVNQASVFKPEPRLVPPLSIKQQLTISLQFDIVSMV